MEGVFVSKRNEFRQRIVQKFNDGLICRKEAARLTGLSERSVTRIGKRIARKGLRAMIHGNLGKNAHNKTNPLLKERVKVLVLNRYFDFNLCHILEKLKQEQGVELGYHTLRRWCSDWKLVKGRHKRRSSKVRKQRVRMPSKGMLLQMDGSPHRYNGKEEWCLITAIDDASSDIDYGEFFEGETTFGCLKVVKRIIEKNGIPEAIYTDRAGWSGGQKRASFTQFKRMCDELGIELIFAYSPEAKGRIERAFRTIQDRLVPELRLQKIKDKEATTDYFNQVFLPQYWQKNCVVAPRDLRPSYRPLPQSLDLNEIFCIKEFRCIKKNHQFSYDGIIWEITSPLKHSIQGQNIEIREYMNGGRKYFFANQPIEIKEVERQVSPKAIFRNAA